MIDSYWLQLQDAVTAAHETSDLFSEEALREQAIFQYAKEAEMKEIEIGSRMRIRMKMRIWF